MNHGSMLRRIIIVNRTCIKNVADTFIMGKYLVCNPVCCMIEDSFRWSNNSNVRLFIEGWTSVGYITHVLAFQVSK